MDIIQFLTDDHELLRKDHALIHNSLGKEDLRDQLKKHIAHMELHELVEDGLFEELKKLSLNSNMKDFISDYEKEHERIWDLLDELMDSLNSNHFPVTQQIFFALSSFEEWHFTSEERFLFPNVRQIVSSDTLKKLGGAVEKNYEQYYLEVEKA